MNTAGSSDSFGVLMSICQTSDDDKFQSMVDGFDVEESESGHVSEKKRRLSVEQVKALDKSFEVENKLEPDQKLKLARDLGLQPRQVAVWFQNRRARWKTKQLERDYTLLKANYDSLKLTFDSLQLNNDSLLKQIGELKAKLEGGDKTDNDQSNLSVEEEIVLPADPDNALIEQTEPEIDNFPLPPSSEFKDFNNGRGEEEQQGQLVEASLFPDFKDGSSDSDSSAILNEDHSPTAAISSVGRELQNHHHLVWADSPLSTTTSNYIQFEKPNYQTQLYQKMEEHNYYNGEEDCNFFSEDQAPTLHWWN